MSGGEHIVYRSHFDGVAKRRSGTVRLDILDVFGPQQRARQRWVVEGDLRVAVRHR